MESLTDEATAERVQRGDAAAFAVLVERYEVKMLRYAQKFLFGYEDAEDLVQNVFLKAYVNMQGFNIKRRFSPWIYRIAHNEFVNAIKKRGREPVLFFDPDTLFPHPVAKERTDRDILDRELRDTLDTCLNDLDPKYREPLVLYYFEDMNYREIADVMQIPVATVGVRLNRGRELLRSRYHQRTPAYVR